VSLLTFNFLSQFERTLRIYRLRWNRRGLPIESQIESAVYRHLPRHTVAISIPPDRQTDDIITPLADHTMCVCVQYNLIKKIEKILNSEEVG